MTRARPKYTVTIEYPKSENALGWADTQVRRAIRHARAQLLKSPPRSKLTVRGWQPGDTSKRGRVEYQAHLGADGKIIVVEER
jgi:hypothetical protein